VRRAVVLVVDDDPPIRGLARNILEPEGYDVLEAGNADEALAILRGPNEVDLLFADLAMPGTPGEEMARLARIERPDLKILYVSGMIDRLFRERAVLWEGEAFLEKPFTPEGLGQAVALLLFGTVRKP
jgi:two-component system, cell cycle sensor histidine kinase and response regulator CckA